MASLYDGSTFEHEGRTFRVQFEEDYDAGPPWEREDGHGPVRWARHHHVRGLSDKRPWERPLNSPDWSRDGQCYYDWREACRQARHDGWNTEPYDAPDRVQRAVEADYQYLRAFMRQDWCYVGVTVELLDAQGDTVDTESLWGIETWKDYHCELARELADEILARRHQQWREALHEARERRYWAARDVLTVPCRH